MLQLGDGFSATMDMSRGMRQPIAGVEPVDCLDARRPNGTKEFRRKKRDRKAMPQTILPKRKGPPMSTAKGLFYGLCLVAVAIVAAGVMRYSAADNGGTWQLVPRGDGQFLIFNTQEGMLAYTCHMDDKAHKLEC
jgi:hypothetical protein